MGGFSFFRLGVDRFPKVDLPTIGVATVRGAARAGLAGIVGEAGRLLGSDTPTVQRDRVASVQALQARYGGAVVLKGAGSLIADEQGLSLCPYGNPGMGVGGMGDVLTGISAAFLAQGLPLGIAAAAAVTAHACAGDRVAEGGERGLIASDVINALRIVVNP